MCRIRFRRWTLATRPVPRQGLRVRHAPRRSHRRRLADHAREGGTVMNGTWRAGLAVAAAALLVGCTSTPGGSAAPTAHARLLAGQPMAACTISGEVPVNASFPAYCGTLLVPEDRSNPSGRQIGLQGGRRPGGRGGREARPVVRPCRRAGRRQHVVLRLAPRALHRRPRHARHRPRRPARHRRLEPADPARDARHDRPVRRRGRRAP